MRNPAVGDLVKFQLGCAVGEEIGLVVAERADPVGHTYYHVIWPPGEILYHVSRELKVIEHEE